jgi:cation diffusion facilitator CzcD-associated flavoprotein CzcO
MKNSSKSLPDDVTHAPVAVIGAGPSGLAALKNLKAERIACVAYESHSDLGGIWNRANPKSSAYRNTHTITSREVTSYEDFPMGRDLPIYPRHDQVCTYLHDYAKAHDLIPLIRFNSAVENIERLEHGGWRVTASDGSTAIHSAVVIANGHNWYPVYPELPGKFDGQILHSCEYEDAAGFVGKRVLVVGAGNSGCDIAVESAQMAESVALSMRRGYNFYPKFILGKPADQVGPFVRSLRLPMRWSSWIMRMLLRVSVGRQEDLGLPPPDHRPLETPAIVNSLVPYYVAHGRIDIRPAISHIDGRRVEFSNGTHAEFDVIVLATGYKIHIPFMRPEYLSWGKNKPDFYLYAFSPKYDDLFIAGMTDSTGGHFPTVDLQSRVIASYLAAKQHNPAVAEKFDELKRANKVDLTGGIHFIDTPRNATQFSLAAFKNALVEHLCLLRGEVRQVQHPSRVKLLASVLKEIRR